MDSFWRTRILVAVVTPSFLLPGTPTKSRAQVQKQSDVKGVYERQANPEELAPKRGVERQAYLNRVPQWFAELAPAKGDSVRIRNDSNFDPTVNALKTYLNRPAQPNYDNFQTKFAQLEANGEGDWLALLFEVFKESRRDVQENQKYWLKRLEERNKINDALQEYMGQLNEQSRKLNEKVRGASGDDGKQKVRVEIRRFDTPAAAKSSAELGRSELNDLIKEVDAKAQRSRNETDKIKGFFDAWSEKASQVDQQLTSILRTMKDVRRIGVGGSDLGSS